MIDRREFVLGSMAAIACSSDNRAPTTATPQPDPTPAKPDPTPAKPGPKTILILGGTGFLGPHVVDAARARGHTLTLFNRGKTHPKLYPDVEKLQGDRDGKLDALAGRSWDAVVDTSAGFFTRSNARAIAAGLTLRPVLETAADTLAWLASPDVDIWLSEIKHPAQERADVRNQPRQGSYGTRGVEGPVGGGGSTGGCGAIGTLRSGTCSAVQFDS